jgi:hypothetical protein
MWHAIIMSTKKIEGGQKIVKHIINFLSNRQPTIFKKTITYITFGLVWLLIGEIIWFTMRIAGAPATNCWMVSLTTIPLCKAMLKSPETRKQLDNL